MRTKPTPSRLNHHSGLRDESQLTIVAPMSSLLVARGRGATGGTVSYALEVKVRGGASGAARVAGCGDDLAAPEASLINWSTDHCTAATAFSIRERRAMISSSLDGSPLLPIDSASRKKKTQPQHYAGGLYRSTSVMSLPPAWEVK